MTDGDVDQETRAMIAMILDTLSQFAQGFAIISPADAHRLVNAAERIAQTEPDSGMGENWRAVATLRAFAEFRAAIEVSMFGNVP